MSTQQTKARLEALAAKWRDQANKALRRSGTTWSGNDMADRIEYMADDLDQIRSSLPEPGVVSDEAINAAVIAAQDVCPSRILSWKQAEAALEAALPHLTPPTAPEAAPAGEVVDGFDKRFAEMLLGVINDVQNELGFDDEAKQCSNGSLEIVAAIRALQRKAAPQPAPAAQQPVAVDGAIRERAETILANTCAGDANALADMVGDKVPISLAVAAITAALRSGSQPEPQS